MLASLAPAQSNKDTLALHKRLQSRRLIRLAFNKQAIQNDKERAKQGKLQQLLELCDGPADVERISCPGLLQVTGNLKSAQGAVKETLGAAVGAKQMESEGTRSREDLVSFHPDNLVCCLLSAEALRADRRQGYPYRGQH